MHQEKKVIFLSSVAVLFLAGGLIPLPGLASTSADSEIYTLNIKGVATRIDSIKLNGIDCLGGPIRSLKIARDISEDIVDGLNTLKLEGNSAPNSRLEVILEKRTSGPKIEQLVRLQIPPGKDLSSFPIQFNIGRHSVSEDSEEAKRGLTDVDRTAILNLVKDYLEALSTKNSEKLKDLFSFAIKEEKKIRPEAAALFQRMLRTELELMRRDDLKFNCRKLDEVIIDTSGEDPDLVRVTAGANAFLAESDAVVAIKPDPSLTTLMAVAKPPQKGIVRMRLKKKALSVRKTRGEWHLTIEKGD